MRSTIGLGLALVLLAGCGKPSEPKFYEDLAADAAAATAPQALERPATPSVPAGAPMLAYSYGYGLQASPKGVRTLIAKHEAACTKAGPALCQVTGSSVSERGQDQLSAELTLRAAPPWLSQFREGLSADAKDAGGRVVRSEVSTEDLSRQIVDTEAMLRAKITLRDRLQALLASRPGKLADLVELERELSKVQGELDAAQSELAMMRQRVATSDVTISYESGGVLAPQDVWSPIGKAFSDFLGILAATIALLIKVIAWTLPWLLLGGLLIWALRKRLKWPWRRNQKPAA